MDWTTTFFDTIDFRSFSSAWYWLIVAVVQSQSSYFVLGIPFDSIQRARRYGGQELEDLVAHVHINIRRMRRYTSESGAFLVGFGCFLHTVLITLGWGFDLALAKAFELLLLPITGAVILSIMTAQEILVSQPDGARIIKLLLRQRFWVQIIGLVAIFVTALVAMFELFPPMPF